MDFNHEFKGFDLGFSTEGAAKLVGDNGIEPLFFANQARVLPLDESPQTSCWTGVNSPYLPTLSFEFLTIVDQLHSVALHRYYVTLSP